MAKTKSGLKRGDAVVVKDRLWAIVDAKGRIAYDNPFAVFSTKADAIYELNLEKERGNAEGYSVVRLNDVTGTVV